MAQSRIHGGQIVAQGELHEILESKDSLTADYLIGRTVVNENHSTQTYWR